MLNIRQKSVLDAVIREFVKTAEPVSSGRLVEKYRFPFSPATVRNDFLILEQEGYLEQPHTSAGRIPTEKGYRFFVDAHTDNSKTAAKPRHNFEELRRTSDAEHFLRVAARRVAALSDGFVFVGFPQSDLFFTSGIAHVLDEPEFDDMVLRTHFAELIDGFDAVMEELFSASDFSEPRVFIGSENPVAEAKQYSMIVATLETPYNQEGIVSIFGPTRMDYARNIALLRELQGLL